MKRFRKITALFLTLLMVFSFMSMQNVYAVTEMSAEEQERIISIFGELPPERSENKTFAQRVAELFSTRAATISDGVYYIKNNATGFYLNVADDSPEETAQVEVTGKCTVNPSGNNPNKLTQLWRVTRVSGGYILRPLHMLNLTFAAHTRNNIIAMTYYDTNSNVVMYGKWDIDGSINDCNIVDTTFSKAVTLDADYNIAFTDDQYDDNASWSFEPATNIPSGVIVYNSKIRYNLGETSIITASAYSPTLQFGTVTWSTANSSIASLSQISSDGTQKKVVRRSVKGSGTGVTSLTMTCATDSSIKTTYYVAVNQLADGQYFVRNKKSDYYMAVKGPSMASGVNIQQEEGTAQDSELWILKFNSEDGYYTIQSAYSSLYLTVKNNSASANTNIVQSTGNTASGQRWNITKLSNGAYKLVPKCAGSLTLGLATNNKVSGTLLVSKAYDTSANYSDWCISPAIYGRQPFRQLDSWEWNRINCAGYAMNQNFIPNFMTTEGNDFYDNARKGLLSSDYTLAKVKEDTFSYAKNGFEKYYDSKVINGKTISVKHESNFSGNGENLPLQANQYRVVLRTGADYEGTIDGKKYYSCDYHFWYQTFDGRWANKHGHLTWSVSRPILLPEGENPFSTDTSGWNMDVIDDYTGEVLGTINNYYDSEIVSYVVTIS